MAETPKVIDTPLFLKFAGVYAKKFRAQNGFGRWLKEYQKMEAQGLFNPKILRILYKKILTNTFRLTFIEQQAVYYIGVLAQDAAQAYFDIQDKSLYKICVITGETAIDEDDEEYTNLEYQEAQQICKALNDEAEEELFFIKKI